MLHVLAANDEIATVVIIGGIVIALVAIIGGYICGAKKARLREESRREIAAYIAEGSMTFEQGEKLLKAGEEEDE